MSAKPLAPRGWKASFAQTDQAIFARKIKPRVMGMPAEDSVLIASASGDFDCDPRELARSDRLHARRPNAQTRCRFGIGPASAA
jgi:hypothetical protein